MAKKDLTIPRLELVSGHMAVNLAHNVREALAGFPVSGVYCWLDSTVALPIGFGNLATTSSSSATGSARFKSVDNLLGVMSERKTTQQTWKVEEEASVATKDRGGRARTG